MAILVASNLIRQSDLSKIYNCDSGTVEISIDDLAVIVHEDAAVFFDRDVVQFLPNPEILTLRPMVLECITQPFVAFSWVIKTSEVDFIWKGDHWYASDDYFSEEEKKKLTQILPVSLRTLRRMRDILDSTK